VRRTRELKARRGYAAAARRHPPTVRGSAPIRDNRGQDIRRRGSRPLRRDCTARRPAAAGTAFTDSLDPATMQIATWNINSGPTSSNDVSAKY